MATGQTIIERAMRLLSALDTGGSPTAEQQAEMLVALNAMLDSWNTDRLIVFSVERKTFTLTAGLNPHTIGSGGNLNVTRPVKIENASIVDGTLEYPLEILNLGRYQELADKATETTIPDSLYYDPQMDATSRGRLYLWPVPSSANTLVLYLWTPLTTAIAWATTLVLPPGYERAIVYNLAVEIAPELSRNPSEFVVRIAKESLANIKAINAPILYAEPDEDALAGQGEYNIYTNNYE